MLVGLFAIMHLETRQPCFDANGMVLEVLDALLKVGEVERVKAPRVSRLRLLLLPMGYVGRVERRMGSAKDSLVVGRVMSRWQPTGTVGRPFVIPATENQVEIRWIPPIVLELVRKIQVLQDGRVLELRGLRPLFVLFLQDVAFVEDWVAGESLAREVTSIDKIETPGLSDPVVSVIRAIQRAVSVLTDEQRPMKLGAPFIDLDDRDLRSAFRAGSWKDIEET